VLKIRVRQLICGILSLQKAPGTKVVGKVSPIFPAALLSVDAKFRRKDESL